MSMVLLRVFCFLLILELVFSATIKSGIPWFDDQGNRIEAHGGGFLLVGKKYYWYGETKKSLPMAENGVNCYSSEDLATWHFEGQVLFQRNITVSTKGPYIVERPKVVYNEKTSKYVLWFHLDTSSYSLRSVGVATSDTPNGEFTFVKGFQPDGLGSLDMTVYKDDDGSAYHVRSVQNQYVGVSKLSDDYLNTTGISSSIGEAREGPAVFKYKGLYYLVTSHLSGWAPNAMELFVGGSDLKSAKWTSLGNPTASSTTFDSQSTNVLIFDNQVIYQGDRWNQAGAGGLANATYIWLPMVPSGSSFKIAWVESWEL